MKTNFFKNIIKIDNITNSEKLALGIILLVLMMIIMSVINNINIEEKIGYSDFNIEEVITESVNINDRQKYFDLYEIISNYLSSYNLEINALSSNIDYDKIKYTRDEYYLTLTEEYKKEISKKEYMQISEKFCKKFLKSNTYSEYVSVDKNIIKKIYKLSSKKYGENMYICELNSNVDNELAYIGIYLNQKQKKYNIFYID